MYLVQSSQPLTPIIVQSVGAPTQEINTADVLIGAFGITGLFLVGAAILGVGVGVLLIVVRSRLAARHDDRSSTSAFQLTVPPPES